MSYQKKNTTLILYPPGGYGTFLHWCLCYFSGELKSDRLPFTKNGSSHNFNRPRFDNLDHPLWSNCLGNRIKNYLQGSTEFSFVRTHGFTDIPENSFKTHVEDYVDFVIDYVQNIVLLEPSADVRLLLLNNIRSKTTQLEKQHLSQFGPNMEHVPPWQLREIILHWIENSMRDNDNYKNLAGDKIIRVSIRHLVDDFESTLRRLFEQLGLTLVKEDKIAYVQEEWLKLQKYKNSDALCKKIVQCTVDNTEFDWDPSSIELVEEAYIQFELRTVYNLDLLCYNLDVFPNSSQSLRKLLIDYK